MVPWTGDELAEAAELLTDISEYGSILHFRKKCQQANIPPEIIRQMESDVRWNAKAKAGLQRSGSRVTAKWLNKWGVPGGFGDELGLVIALGKIGKDYLSVTRRLDELIAVQTKAAAPPAKPGEKKEGAA